MLLKRLKPSSNWRLARVPATLLVVHAPLAFVGFALPAELAAPAP